MKTIDLSGLAKPLVIRIFYGVLLLSIGPALGWSQDAPQILTQPSDVSVAIGSAATLKVEASGASGPLFYQWQWYATDLWGMTNATLNIDSAQLCQAGLYTVAVSNNAGQVVSSPAVLSVVGIAAWGYAYEESGYVPTGISDAVAVGVTRTYAAVLRANGTVQAVGANDQGELNIPTGLTNAVAVSVGEHHGLALTANRSVVQWGSKLFGQGSVPVNLSDVLAVSAGAFHSLALKADNTLVAWGRNAYGEALVPQDLTDVVAISAGYTHNLALKADGKVICWGDSTYVPPGLERVVAIAAGDSHNLVLKSDGTVLAWGNNSSGQATVPSGLFNVAAIAAGGYQSLALKTDGTVASWGLVDDMWHSHMPGCLNNVVAVAAAVQHNIALVGSGAPFITKQPVSHSAGVGTFTAFRAEAAGAAPLLYQWRLNGVDLPGETRDTLVFESVCSDQAGAYSVVVANQNGHQTSEEARLSVSGLTISFHPQNEIAYLSGNARMSVGVAGEPPFHYQWRFENKDIVGATESVLMLSNVDWSCDGTYNVAVSNDSGSVVSSPARLSVRSIATCGNAFSGRNNVPARLTNVVAIAEGGDHMLALLADGTVRAWGQNLYGQVDVPQGLTNVIAIAAGDVLSVALKEDGTVVTWGFNDSAIIKPPAGLNGVVAIAAAWANVVALKADGTVAAWGSNSQGLNNGPPGLRNVVAISLAQDFCVALHADGSVAGWGNAWATLFAPPNDLKEVVAVAAGGVCCMALKKDGSVETWGPDPSNIRLVQPTDLADVIGISAGDNHLLALNARGTVSAWGSGSHGQTNVPLDLPPASMISAGRAHTSALVGSGPPWVVTHPMSFSGGIGTSVGLRVVATGAWPLSYQWRLNGLELSGATNSILWISDLQATNAGAYSVVVTNRYGAIITSEAVMSVGGVSVTTQPMPQVAFQGGMATLEIEATGQQPIQYQWSFEGADIPGATNAILTLTNLQPAQAGHYSARPTNPFGSVDSSAATLTVLPVLIKAQPISRQVLAGGSLSFEVSVEGIGPFTYQWQFNGVDMTGMTNSTLQLENALPAQAGAYSVVVSNAFGSVASLSAQCYVLTVAGWGGNSYGQISIPLGLTNVVAIAGGGDYTLALKADGTVTAWGDFRFGQTNAPKGLNGVIAIARGALHNLALRADGTVIGWGDNSHDQTNTPAGLAQVTAISAGAYHNLALATNGAVTAWGDDQLGQSDVPSNLSNVVAIAAIANYNLVLLADGTVAAWGDNTFGQTDVPAGLTNVIAIAGEARHAMALKLDGTVVSWGQPSQQGGAGPVGLTNVVAIAGGDAHDVTLLADGSVLSWGDDSQGQLDVPTGLTNVMAVAAGREHTIALLSDGSPKVTVQPWDRTVTDNADLVIAAKAVGIPPLQYQWQFNGVDIPGATQETYPILNAQPSSAGNYTLVISNKVGVASTRKNKLSVVAAHPAVPRFVPGSPVRHADGSFQVRVEAVLGCTVSFEHSDDLIHWVKFGSETNATGQILLTPPSSATSRFYRLKSSE
jgi:alpha-tubulin suppressor-like RCC1 family protein